MADPKDPTQTIPGFYAPGQERRIGGVSGQWSAMDNLTRSFYLDTWVGQSAMAATSYAQAINEKGKFVDDKNYNPLADPENEGYEQYVLDSHSSAESYYLRTLARRNNNLRRELEVGGAGPTRFLSQFADPVTYLPIPLAKGIGFVRGAQKSFGPVAASITASEGLRHSIDPTSTPEETMIGITFGTMFGTALGGAAGSLGRSSKYAGYEPKTVLDRMGERYRQLLENSDGPAGQPKTFEEAANELNNTAASQGFRFVNDPEAPGNTVVNREAGEIRVNEERIRAEYKSGKLLQGVMARLGERSATTFSNLDMDKLKKWFDENGGEDRYVQFMLERELGRQKVFAKDPNAPALDAMGESILERSIFENALRKSGARVTDVLEVGVPKEILERQRMAEERLKVTEDEIARIKGEKFDKQAKAAELRRKADEAPEFRADGRKNNARTNWLNQADKLDQEAAKLDESIATAQEKQVGQRNDLDSINTKIDDLGQIDDIELMALASTGIGLEKVKWQQLPWYAMNNTKFRELSPRLAKEFIQMAWQLAGSPGLRTVGAKYGIAMDVSVEMLAKQWMGRLRSNVDNTRKIYMRYLKDVEATRGQGYLEVFKQNMPFIGKTPQDGRMSWSDFKESVSKAMFNNDAPTDNPFVDEAVRGWRTLFDEFEKAGKELNVFQSVRVAQRNFDKASARVDTLMKGQAKPKELEIALRNLDEAEQALEMAKAIGDTEGKRYFHVMWRADLVQKNREVLRQKLTAHFMQQSGRYINGKYVAFDNSPVAIAARVDEAIVNIEKASTFNDGIGLINKGDKVAIAKNRIEKYREEIKVRGDQEFADGLTIREVREKQIELIERDLEAGNVAGLGGPSPVISRKLDIDHSQYTEFMELDIETVAHHYTMRMGPVVEMARKFGDYRIDNKLSMLRQIIDEEIAANPANADAIRAEGEKMIEAAETLRDKVLGVYGIPENPDALHERALAFGRTWNTLSFMGGAAQIATVDAGKVVMSEGFTRSFGGLLKNITDRLEKGPKSDWYIAGKEVEMAGEALDTVFAARIQQIYDIGGGYHNMTAVERWAQQQTGPFFFLNGLSLWTDTMKRFSGSMIQSRMIEDSVAWAAGKLPQDRIEKLAAAGISESWAKRFARQWTEAGSQKGDSLFLANTEGWTDREAVNRFRAILASEVNVAVITPGAADKFNFMSGAVGKTMMQYRSFGLAATQRVLMSGLQARDRSALLGALSMVALAAIVDSARRPDYIDLDMSEIMFRSVETSGVLGIFSDINSALEIASGNQFGLRPMLGFNPLIKDTNWASRTGAVAGAAPSQFLQLLYAVSDPDATASEQARAYRYALPLNNVVWWDDIVTRQQRGLAETLED